MLNQFSKERPEHITLADFLPVSKDIYPVGRLDKDSEGLLILTNDKSLNAALLSPAQKHKRSYFVQLDNDITDKAIEHISKGVQIKLEDGVYYTHPCSVKKLHKAPVLPERDPPVRYRQNIPTSWALIELTEGKNRQVRKMFASVQFPVLRLVRVQIEDLKIGKLEPGKYSEIKKEDLFTLLKIEEKQKTPYRKDTRKVSTQSEEKVKSSVKKVTKKNAIPKSGYANAPKKSTTARIAAKTSAIGTDTPPKKVYSPDKSTEEFKSFTNNRPPTKGKYNKTEASSSDGAPKKSSYSVNKRSSDDFKSSSTNRPSAKGKYTRTEGTSSDGPQKKSSFSAKVTKRSSEEFSSAPKRTTKKSNGTAPWQKPKPTSRRSGK